MSELSEALSKFVDEACLSDEFFCLCARPDTFHYLVNGDLGNIAELIAKTMRDDPHIADAIHKAENIYLASQIVDNGN